MPRLLRGMARTAVIAGTATAVAGSVSHSQQQKYAAQAAAAQPAPAPAEAASTDDKYAELEKLGKLKEQGILTQEEFDRQKTLILG